MHRIESITLQGFKSFREKVGLRFPGNVSAVVGPNGCGKSNICDAFLWVLGEQNARVLRGQRMEDVIFNGTERARPVGFAEVTLRLSPRGDAAMGTAAEGLEISRQLHRDGTSEYALNGRRCRLLDIHERFEGTGLGFTSYAIIEQGHILNITASKPLALRALIEEAARIVSFKQRKRAALGKLEQAQANLLRIHDLIGEIERNLRALQTQVGRARRYQALRARMRRFQRLRLRLLGRRWGEQGHQLAQQQEQLLGRVAEAERVIREGSGRLVAVRAEVGVAEGAVEGLRRRQAELELSLQRINTSREFLTEERRTLRERAASLEVDRDRLDRQAEGDQARQADLSTRLGEWRRERDDAQVSHDAAAGEYRRLAGERTERERQLEELRVAVFGEAGALTDLRNQEAQLAEQDRWLARERDRRQGELTEGRSAVTRLEGAARDSAEALAEVEADLSDLLAAHAEVEGLLQEARADVQGRRRGLEAKGKEQDGRRHRLRSLEELEARHDYFTDAVRQFLALVAGDPAFQGTVADLIGVVAGHEQAVEHFLRHELETLLVSDPQLLERARAFMTDHRGGTCRFLLTQIPTEPDPLGGRPGLTGRPGVVGRLLDLLGADESARRLLVRAIPQLATVWLVADWATACRLALEGGGVTCLTPDGAAVSSDGRVILHGPPAGKGVLGYRKEQRELARVLAEVDRELEELENALQERVTEVDELDGKREELARAIQEIRLRGVRCQEESRRAVEELARHRKLTATAESELGRVEMEGARVTDELARVRGAAGELDGRRQARQAEYDQCRQEIDRLRQAVEQAQGRSDETRTALATAGERLRAAEAEGRALERAGAERAERQALLAVETRKAAQRQSQIDEELAAFERDGACQAEELAGLADRVARAQDELETCRRLVAEEEGVQDGLRDELEAFRRQLGTVEVERARLDGEWNHLEETCRLEFHLGLTEVAEEPDDPDDLGVGAEEAQARYLEAREQVERMGSVNLVAVEAYDQEAERLAFHRTQQADITASIESTQKAIEEFDRRSARLFRETLEQVNLNFREMFCRLFGGGHAELRLTEEGDILEGGLEIVASPPGKKLQNILLLSGGEKALAALSLLLAIFKYRPSPFCLLDEVDAPLDDSNIDRFIDLVKGMSHQTQFILITHNKRTIEIADSITGVTMEEAGISKVLSVQMKEVDAVLDPQL